MSKEKFSVTVILSDAGLTLDVKVHECECAYLDEAGRLVIENLGGRIIAGYNTGEWRSFEVFNNE